MYIIIIITLTVASGKPVMLSLHECHCLSERKLLPEQRVVVVPTVTLLAEPERSASFPRRLLRPPSWDRVTPSESRFRLVEINIVIIHLKIAIAIDLATLF